MTESLVDQLVARFDGEVAITRAHLCESEIADRKVTRCGRQLAERAGTEIRVAPGVPACRVCHRQPS